MGVKLRERPGKGWYVIIDWRGQRKAKSFGKNKALAKEFRDKMEAKLKLGDIGVTTKTSPRLQDYTQKWLEEVACKCKHSTHQDYQWMMNKYILPSLGHLALKDISRGEIKTLAYRYLNRKLKRKTVLYIIRCLSSLLTNAQEDGEIENNPALRPGQFLPKEAKHKVVPLTREEATIFLKAVKERNPRYYPVFLCSLRTGLRLGEIVALQWGDIDFQGRFIEVRRNFSRGRLTTPKSGQSRRVDMSLELTKVLGELQTCREAEAIANEAIASEWVFSNSTGGRLDPDHLRNRTFYGLLKAIGLRRVRFHDLRHTFASLLLQQGESMAYIRDQMGHSSIRVTVDVYGHLIPGTNKGAVDRLDFDQTKAESATQAQPNNLQSEKVTAAWPPSN